MATKVGTTNLGFVNSNGQLIGADGNVIPAGIDATTKASLLAQLEVDKLRHSPSEMEKFVKAGGVTTEAAYVPADSAQSGDRADLDAKIAARP